MGDAYVNLGSMMIKKRQFPEALDQINKGLALGMSLPHVGYYDRTLAHQALGQFKEAYFDYKKALELEPTFQQARRAAHGLYRGPHRVRTVAPKPVIWYYFP
jgi:tetratricopeptide (TPR) repeat protein